MPNLQWTLSTLPAGNPPRATTHLRAVAPVHIETHGYLLRTVVPGDITTRMVDWVNSEAMRTGLNLPPLNFSLDRLRAFVDGFDSLNNHFIGIFDRATAQLIGFYTLDVNLAHKVGNITCGIGEPEYLGRRVLWHTIDALLDHFFTYRDVHKVTARILAKNQHMLFNFIDNTRFVWEAKLQRECLAANGERLDVLVFAAHRDGCREDGTAP
ncbi:GNAT family N-acetyltransferase [Dyella amyloliquefaciens]|uniref:GNAT family N-acetyltransferase n=1 Tax=Dyella amyloliquefaciens TaxID=1770545 RepID=UPI00197A9079|nr:GNAT family protein [Dyella amyloliquefaciens]